MKPVPHRLRVFDCWRDSGLVDFPDLRNSRKMVVVGWGGSSVRNWTFLKFPRTLSFSCLHLCPFLLRLTSLPVLFSFIVFKFFISVAPSVLNVSTCVSSALSFYSFLFPSSLLVHSFRAAPLVSVSSWLLVLTQLPGWLQRETVLAPAGCSWTSRGFLHCGWASLWSSSWCS